MTGPARRLATYEDLARLPDGVRAEILAGEIVVTPAPLPRHSKAQGAVRRFIGGAFDDDDGFGGPGGWWTFIEVDVQFGAHDVVRPDLSGWRRARLSSPGDLRPIDVTPDWVCEVVSPSTVVRDRGRKRALYAAHGVPFCWLIDTDARLLEAFELVDGRWTVIDSYGEDAVARVPPFEAVELAVGRLFLPPAE